MSTVASFFGCGSDSYSALSPVREPGQQSQHNESRPEPSLKRSISRGNTLHVMAPIPEDSAGKSAADRAMELLNLALGGAKPVTSTEAPAATPATGDDWARAEGDVESPPAKAPEQTVAVTIASGGGVPTADVNHPVTYPVAPVVVPAMANPIGNDNGRVQVPIGMVADTSLMRRNQAVALTCFTLLNTFICAAIFVGALYLTGWPRLALIAAGGCLWLSVLVFNVRMAGRPSKVLQVFLNNKRKSRLGDKLGRGQIVIVRGAVSILKEEVLSAEFHNVPGLVLVESSLRSYYPGVRKADAWVEHVRQTRAVDFRITDAVSGVSAVVRACTAAEIGLATPLVHVSTEVPLPSAPVAAPAKSVSPEGKGAGGPVAAGVVVKASGKNGDKSGWMFRSIRAQAQSPELLVCKGYIRQGQVITIMGCLYEEPGTNEMVIEPLEVPYNVSKFLICSKFLPYFFPTWASGLVISDQRDL